MALLPLIQDDNQAFVQMQTRWKSVLDPLLKNLLLSANQLENIQLRVGETQINHLLSRKQTGWIVTDQNGGASIYRSKPLNDKTLTLTSDANVVVSLLVY